jgi:hypothetical protein
MPARLSYPLALSIWLLTLACWVAALSMRFAYSLPPLGSSAQHAGSVFETPYQVLVAATFLGIPSLGLLVASRRPTSYFGWLLLPCGLFIALLVLLTAYVRVEGGALTNSAVLAAWVENWVGIPALVCSVHCSCCSRPAARRRDAGMPSSGFWLPSTPARDAVQIHWQGKVAEVQRDLRRPERLVRRADLA